MKWVNHPKLDCIRRDVEWFTHSIYKSKMGRYSPKPLREQKQSRFDELKQRVLHVFCQIAKLLKQVKNKCLDLPDFIVSFLRLINQIISLKKSNNKHLCFKQLWMLLCNFILYYFVMVSHQQPFIIDSWGDKKCLPLFFGKENTFCDRRITDWNNNLFTFKLEVIFTGL